MTIVSGLSGALAGVVFLLLVLAVPMVYFNMLLVVLPVYIYDEINCTNHIDSPWFYVLSNISVIVMCIVEVIIAMILMVRCL